MPDRTLRSAFAAGVWLPAMIGIGAWASHFFYNGGKALADVARNKPINAPVNWLAGLCGRADFADFHRFSVILFTLLGTLPFLAWLLRKPEGPLRSELAALLHDRRGVRQALQAMPLCLAFSLAITFLTDGSSAITAPPAPVLWLVGACTAGLLVELMLRGVVLRLFSASFPASGAITASGMLHALFFSALFPRGIDTWESVLSSGRFPLASSLASGLADPARLFGQTLPFLLVGLALGWARTHSPSPWLAAGTQTGLLLAWQITPHPLPALLAAVLTVFVFLGRPSPHATREP